MSIKTCNFKWFLRIIDLKSVAAGMCEYFFLYSIANGKVEHVIMKKITMKKIMKRKIVKMKIVKQNQNLPRIWVCLITLNNIIILN